MNEVSLALSLEVPVDIVIADDRQLICEGIDCLLREHVGIRVQALARTRGALLDVLHDAVPTVVLLSPRLDPRGGVALLHDLRYAAPRLPVLVLASDADSDDPVALLRAGARGYLSRDNDVADLLHAVRKVADGGLYVSKALGESIAADLSTRPRNDSYAELSPRETEVFGFLAQGHTVTQIADALSLSAKTVSTHKSRLMGRLGLGTLAELIQYAISHGLIEGGDAPLAGSPAPSLDPLSDPLSDSG